MPNPDRSPVGAAFDAMSTPTPAAQRAESILEMVQTARIAAQDVAPDVRERLAEYLCALREGHMRTAKERAYWFRKADETLALFPQLARPAQHTLREALAKMFFLAAHPLATWNAGHEDDGSQHAYDDAYSRADEALALIAAQEAPVEHQDAIARAIRELRSGQEHAMTQTGTKAALAILTATQEASA